MRKLDLTGERFGRLVALQDAGKTERGQSLWLCHCDCGAEKVIRLSSLRSGESLSCGCRKLEPNLDNTTHGKSKSPVYRVWTNMKARCFDRNHQAFPNYGGRGITVCERWLQFENFYADMGDPPAGLELDRFPDNDGNYEPGNCRWATRSESQRNRRSKQQVKDDKEYYGYD